MIYTVNCSISTCLKHQCLKPGLFIVLRCVSVCLCLCVFVCNLVPPQGFYSIPLNRGSGEWGTGGMGDWGIGGPWHYDAHFWHHDTHFRYHWRPFSAPWSTFSAPWLTFLASWRRFLAPWCTFGTITHIFGTMAVFDNLWQVFVHFDGL